MIDANNKSRVYLGVHWYFDCERATESGARIADAIYRHAYTRTDDRWPTDGPRPRRR